MNEEDYNLYVLAELSYKKEHPELKDEDLFPYGWYQVDNYKLKVEIIGEALEKNITIKETNGYLKIIEGLN